MRKGNIDLYRVSILVLLDVPHKESIIEAINKLPFRFNPCFIGCSS